MSKPLRILYAAGPGNVLGTYRHWKEGKDDPTQIAMTYSGQFYDVVRDLDARAYVIATCPIPGKLKDGNFRIVHRRVPFQNSSGFLYHFGQFYYGLRLLVSALRLRANVAVVCAGTHWFVLWLMTLMRIKVIPTLHCVLWTKIRRQPTFFQRVIQVFNGWFFSHGCAAIISVSDEISRQVAELTANRSRPVTAFVPQYRRSSFAKIRAPQESVSPFNVLYVGRIETNKGVFEVVEIARRLRKAGRTEFQFDLCGDGSALEALRTAIDAAGLNLTVRCHGHCDQSTMAEMYSRSHVVIVPTTSDFIEGFNKVVAEGVLAGRPVITSSVCPALALVRDSVLEVPPDDVAAYTDAVMKLRDDMELYRAKRSACDAAREQFYDHRKGWAAVLEKVLASIDRHPNQTAEWPSNAAGKLQ
jgi:glycosyltransferase involved in cell wall biosynthesis